MSISLSSKTRYIDGHSDLAPYLPVQTAYTASGSMLPGCFCADIRLYRNRPGNW